VQTETPIEVTEAHTDSLGHLNHVAVVRFLEKARYEWYETCGLFSGEHGQLGTVVVNINYDYRRECFLGERLRVLSRGISMGTKSMVVGHEIIKPDGGVAVEGRATSVVMDLRARRIIPVPGCVAEHLSPAYVPGSDQTGSVTDPR
jgi:YbgC/YbaW family acyl-CoA thioester hydrolase